MHGMVLKTQKAGKQKTQVLCPVKDCKKKVIDLIRHLTSVHDWDKDEAKVARGKFDLRKQRILKEDNVRKNYKKMVCLLITCQQIVKRLRNHLSQTHKIRDNEVLKRMMSASKAYIDVHGIEETVEAPPVSFSDKGKFVKKQDAVAMPVRQDCSAEESSASVASEYEELNEYEELKESTESLSDRAVFNGLTAWLMSLDGGLKKERDASLHVAQLKRILKHVDAEDPDENNILELFNTKALNEKWLCSFQKEKKPGTLKAFLHSLLHFCDFVVENQAMFDVEEEFVRKVRSKSATGQRRFAKM